MMICLYLFTLLSMAARLMTVERLPLSHLRACSSFCLFEMRLPCLHITRPSLLDDPYGGWQGSSYSSIDIGRWMISQYSGSMERDRVEIYGLFAAPASHPSVKFISVSYLQRSVDASVQVY